MSWTTVFQILTISGLLLDVTGAFYLARGSGLWQEVFALPAQQRSSCSGALLLWLLEGQSGCIANVPWWKVDSFRGIVCLLVGFLFQVPSTVRALFS